jgi:predicted nucleic acid-binding protein
VIYLDSCALVKLIREEEESAALLDWLGKRVDVLVVTSELAQAEVTRVVRRTNHTDQGKPVDAAALAEELSKAAVLLGTVRQIVINKALLVKAGALDQPMVRTLDAIHLSSALELGSADLEFVTYDRRLATAADRAGLSVATPR